MIPKYHFQNIPAFLYLRKMNVKELVLEIRNNRTFGECQEYFAQNPNQIKNLIQLLIKEKEYPIPEYSSWIIVHLCKSDREQILPFQKIFIDFVFTNKNQSVCRNTLNIIKHLGITSYRESDFIDLLLSYIKDFNSKVAVQVYSMHILAQYVLKYPELKPEIIEIIDLHSEKKTPAYSSGKRKFLYLTKKV